jgi:spore germination cell wall hydrolase CwlJ-like protein
MLEKSRIFFFYSILILFVLMTGVLAKINFESYRMAVYAEQSAAEVVTLAKKTIRSVNVEHIRCLATNIYWEARSEPFMGQVAVARVVMNRIKHGFAPNPCKVIYQSITVQDKEDPNETKKICQFSWVCEGKTTPTRNSTYLQAEEIARKVLSENKWQEVLPSNVLFFHNKTVNPQWQYHPAVTIGNHVFYTKAKQKQ